MWNRLWVGLEYRAPDNLIISDKDLSKKFSMIQAIYMYIKYYWSVKYSTDHFETFKTDDQNNSLNIKISIIWHTIIATTPKFDLFKLKTVPQCEEYIQDRSSYLWLISSFEILSCPTEVAQAVLCLCKLPESIFSSEKKDILSRSTVTFLFFFKNA